MLPFIILSFCLHRNKFQNLPQKCFTYVPSNEEVDEYPDIKSFEIKLSIRYCNGPLSISLPSKGRLSNRKIKETHPLEYSLGLHNF